MKGFRRCILSFFKLFLYFIIFGDFGVVFWLCMNVMYVVRVIVREEQESE